MKRSDLIYDFPAHLIATAPRQDHRCLLWNGSPNEVSSEELMSEFKKGDVVVINDTKVSKRRIFTVDGLEVLFLGPAGGPAGSPSRDPEKVSIDHLNEPSSEGDPAGDQWHVLFPARGWKLGAKTILPGDVEMTLIAKGLPQTVRVSSSLGETYFQRFGEFALPPYIQKARDERHMKSEDEKWYQTEWAEKAGSSAAPTASLHFTNQDWQNLKDRGVIVEKVTLHVGLGTFLPIKVEDLNEHDMHGEWGYISQSTQQTILEAKKKGHRIWALGTTSLRILESWPKGLLQKTEEGHLQGETHLFIKPGFQFEVVDVLMTNFHQPESTLLCLVSAFAGTENVRSAYQWAIEKEFRLFSYGDLSVWMKS
ncbi:MAG: S-adenosylmethionine:tRNA ribosyltransferase-isomerase [Bdellovibrionales bacterium]|nr:S-adenosylmethionine:tRNA ribosyltransferase-isomerase [Bdellovibrionales bacterium]